MGQEEWDRQIQRRVEEIEAQGLSPEEKDQAYAEIEEAGRIRAGVARLPRIYSMEEHLNSPEFKRAIREEEEASRPAAVLSREHGEDWLNAEQADWEEDDE